MRWKRKDFLVSCVCVFICLCYFIYLYVYLFEAVEPTTSLWEGGGCVNRERKEEIGTLWYSPIDSAAPWCQKECSFGNIKLAVRGWLQMREKDFSMEENEMGCLFLVKPDVYVLWLVSWTTKIKQQKEWTNSWRQKFLEGRACFYIRHLTTLCMVLSQCSYFVGLKRLLTLS